MSRVPSRACVILVTIHVRTDRELDILSRLLRSLCRRYVARHTVSFILVDDSCGDSRHHSELDRFRRLMPDRVTVLSLPAHPRTGRSWGYVDAWNCGADHALRMHRASFDLLSLNMDVIIERDLVAAFASVRSGMPLLGSASPVVNVIGSYRDEEWWSHGGLSSSPQALEEAPLTHGACWWIPSEVLKRVGLLSSYLRPGYGDELDWCVRASQLGYRHYRLNRVVVRHQGSASFGSLLRKTYIARNANRLWLRLGGLTLYRRAAVWIALSRAAGPYTDE